MSEKRRVSLIAANNSDSPVFFSYYRSHMSEKGIKRQPNLARTDLGRHLGRRDAPFSGYFFEDFTAACRLWGVSGILS